MPDIFIPIDTTGISDYFMAIRNSGLLYRYALKFTEDNRETMKKYQGPDVARQVAFRTRI